MENIGSFSKLKIIGLDQSFLNNTPTYKPEANTLWI